MRDRQRDSKQRQRHVRHEYRAKEMREREPRVEMTETRLQRQTVQRQRQRQRQFDRVQRQRQRQRETCRDLLFTGDRDRVLRHYHPVDRDMRQRQRQSYFTLTELRVHSAVWERQRLETRDRDSLWDNEQTERQWDWQRETGMHSSQSWGRGRGLSRSAKEAKCKALWHSRAEYCAKLYKNVSLHACVQRERVFVHVHLSVYEEQLRGETTFDFSTDVYFNFPS